MTTRTIDPAEEAIVSRLIDLGIGSARQTLREALRIGYSIEAVAGVLDWFESLILIDPDTRERVLPYWEGQLVTRLRDPDSRRAQPSHGKWGGKRAEWTALKLRLDATAPQSGHDRGRYPSAADNQRRSLVESLSREQVLSVLDRLIELLEVQSRSEEQQRAENCRAWCDRAADWEIVPPANVQKFLLSFPVEMLR